MLVCRRESHGLSHGQLVEGQGTGLIRTQDVDAGHLLNGLQSGDNGFHFRQSQGPYRHGHRQHRGQGHGNGSHREDEGKLNQGQDRGAAFQLYEDEHRHQPQAQVNQVIPDMQNSFLKMGHGPRGLDQLGGAAEISVVAGAEDQGHHLPLLGHRPGIGDIPGFFAHRQRFAGQGRLVHTEKVSLKQLDVSGNDITQTEADNVPGNQVLGGNLLLLAVPQYPGLESQLLFQGLQGVGGFILLPESHQGVKYQ